MAFLELLFKTLTALVNLLISIIHLRSVSYKAKNSSSKEEFSTQKKV
ncbi:hypothetical protein [Tepidimicrobium xylanilyticum]|nr:hypothetical protein [Tepidimicrobium xylanilyticum]GMG97335.1 hypothetical protein EN5CB1_21610 [Tepidimicrobium xylanilyticum]